MRKLDKFIFFLIVLVTIIVCGVTGARAAAAAPVRTIYIANDSGKVTDAQIANALPAFQAGLEDLERYWGANVQLALATPDILADPTSEVIDILDDPGACGCYGYHSVYHGTPFGIVSTEGNWTVTFTHELFEEVVDPYIHRASLAGGRFWLVEVGDPVEGDQFAYTHTAADGMPVKISDFVTDRWYRTGAHAQGGRIDFAGHLVNSLHLLPDGYASYWGYAGGHYGWQQVQYPSPMPLRGRG
jgi:hypothetical protein